MGTIKEVPIILNNASQDIEYEGDHQRDTRMVIWTLNFTVKGYIYGKINQAGNGPITHSITSILNSISENDVIAFTMDPTSGIGTYQIGETVYQGYSGPTAVATGKVALFNNNVLYLKNINGNFVSNLPIKAASSSTSYKFTSYIPSPTKLVQIDSVANEPPVVTVDETDLKMDSSNTSITMDKVNTPSVTITEGQ